MTDTHTGLVDILESGFRYECLNKFGCTLGLFNTSSQDLSGTKQDTLQAGWIDLVFAQQTVEFYQCSTQLDERQIEQLAWIALLLSLTRLKSYTCLDCASIEYFVKKELDQDFSTFSCSRGKKEVEDAVATVTEIVSAAQGGDSDQFPQQPMILSGNRLYLPRYYDLEQRLIRNIQQRSVHAQSPDRIHGLESSLRALFDLDMAKQSNGFSDEPDWQALAAANALMHSFLLITGGPGTGKTTTATRILLLKYLQFCMQQYGSRNGMPCIADNDLVFRVKLLAPTGKAATRLGQGVLENLQAAADKIGVDLSHLQRGLPEGGQTIHRFLIETQPINNARLHDALSIPAPLHLLIVDEASMIDLQLMVNLLECVPDGCQIILLGDADQLDSVGPGSVFANLMPHYLRQCSYVSENTINTLAGLTGYDLKWLGACVSDQNQNHNQQINTQECQSPLLDHISVLRKSYRMNEDLKQLADGIIKQNVPAVKAVFDSSQKCRYVTLPELGDQNKLYQEIDKWIRAIAAPYTDYFKLLGKQGSPETLLTVFEQHRILCSNRAGPYGVTGLNRLIEACGASYHSHAGIEPGGQYSGKPILVTRNLPQLGLFNGDIGVLIFSHEADRFDVYFRDMDQNNKKVRSVPLSRISDWECAYAMTIHKSQGSEYEQVSIVIADYADELLSRSLIYTAVTRAKSACTIYADDRSLETCIKRVRHYPSGIYEGLWASTSAPMINMRS